MKTIKLQTSLKTWRQAFFDEDPIMDAVLENGITLDDDDAAHVIIELDRRLARMLDKDMYGNLAILFDSVRHYMIPIEVPTMVEMYESPTKYIAIFGKFAVAMGMEKSLVTEYPQLKDVFDNLKK